MSPQVLNQIGMASSTGQGPTGGIPQWASQQVAPQPSFLATKGAQLQPQTMGPMNNPLATGSTQPNNGPGMPTVPGPAPAAPTASKDPSLTADQQSALTGWGTALGGAPVALTGQTFGNNTDLQSWYDNFNKQFPGAQASLKQIQGSDGQNLGYTVNIGNYDALPKGWQQAMTGPKGGVEMSDPTSHWTGQTISDQGINKDPIWGTSTSMNNIKQPKDTFDNVIGPAIVSMMIGGAAGGMFPGMAGLGSLGTMGSALGNLGMGAANSLVRTGTLNPLGMATGVIGGLTGIPSGLLNMGVGLAQGQKLQAPSPMSAIPYLARYGTNLFGG